MSIEVELKTFITEQQYTDTLVYLKRYAKFLSVDRQEIVQLEAPSRISIQRNTSQALLVTDGAEIKFGLADFNKMIELFVSLGYPVRVKWHRVRNVFIWNGIGVTLDFLKGCGYIVQLEKMADERDRQLAMAELKQRMQMLHIPLSSREEYENKERQYIEHWKDLISQNNN